MIALLFAVAMATDDSTAFADSMIGLWNIGSTVLVITSSNRANCFDWQSRTYFQWRDGMVSPDGKPTGAIIGKRAPTRVAEKGGFRVRIDNVELGLGSFIDFPARSEIRTGPSMSGGDPVIFKPKNDQGPDPLQIFQLDMQGWNGNSYLRYFTWQVFDYRTRAPYANGAATRCGKISDIAVSGTYQFQGRTVVVKITPDGSAANPQPFTGTMDWGGDHYDLKGLRDYTHLWWVATLHTTGERRAEGFGEWAPTTEMTPTDTDGKWKPTDRLYWQAAGPGFDNREQDFMLSRTGD